MASTVPADVSIYTAGTTATAVVTVRHAVNYALAIAIIVVRVPTRTHQPVGVARLITAEERG